MERKHLSTRLLSYLLTFAMLLSFAVPVGAAGGGESQVSFTQVDNSAVSASLLTEAVENATGEPSYAATDLVRVSILLEQPSTLEAGYSTAGIADNGAAMTYRAGLGKAQTDVAAQVQKATGKKLDVVWNLTLAANLISANVEYGQIAAISQVPGVKQVVLETRYEPQEAVTDAADRPNMAIATGMTGTNLAWQAGYTGAGSRVAIIDTGLDTDHQSMDPDALAHALQEDAQKAGQSYEDYLAALDVMDEAEVAEILAKTDANGNPILNAAKRVSGLEASNLYRNLKIPFGFNYIDKGLEITHDKDSQGEHGSHVSGIAVANRYLKRGEEFVSAMDAVHMVGNAPDAQIIVMKVFGRSGGAYDSDYMAAIEDAIVLGCDAVNLSLGSGAPGEPYNETYAGLLNFLTTTDTVVTISSGNSGYWSEHGNTGGYNYLDNPHFQTDGSPGSYTNALTVASADNDGAVCAPFQVDGREFIYNDPVNEYTNKPLATLDVSEDGAGTELEYVFLDFGAPEGFSGIDVTGKEVFCSRGGGLSFYVKGENAVNAGAVATVICNNVEATLNMDLSSYTKDAPCVSIPLSEGQWIQAHSQKATTEDGRTYYTGKMRIYGTVHPVQLGGNPVVSYFSSWGVPGNLSLKPEITAPGGDIYSINGAVSQTDQYELMSGTSMAAPQVAGITALVKQAIRERGLSQEGITDRALAQSLMMSTAVPMRDENGNFFPVIQQGAGLVNTAAATSADTYVLVDGQPDGKVKAELGEDPERRGEYQFAFQIHNLEDRAKTFSLSADVFTQDHFVSYANGNQDETQLAQYMDLTTTALDADVSWTAGGKTILPEEELAACDFNGDGKTNGDDAQALLDYVTGKRSSIQNLQHGDLDGNGKVETYDAHLLLQKLRNDTTVSVPAGGSVEIQVSVRLTQKAREFLTDYVGGAYVEAFVNAKALADEEGVVGASHSIPVLAYYGSWTDAPMFDVGSYMEYSGNAEYRTPYLGNPDANFYGITYGDTPGSAYYFGGNPVLDEFYKPERNAINSTQGNTISMVGFAAIRNAAASRFCVTNLETGKILQEAQMGAVDGAFYYVNGGKWYNTENTMNINWTPDDSLQENDRVELSLTLAPALYVKEEGRVDWEALGKGASLSMPVTIDNTAPTLDGVSVDPIQKTMTVKAHDNQYIAAVVLFNAGGATVLDFDGTRDGVQAGDTCTYELDLQKANGNKFLVQVIDYANNVTTYVLKMQLGEEQPVPEMFAFDGKKGCWIGFNRGDTRESAQEIAVGNHTFFGATAADGVIVAIDGNADLYILNPEDLTEETFVTNLGMQLTDLAYNPKDQELYGVNNSNQLVRIDKLCGSAESLGAIGGDIGIVVNTLACDGEGNFYTVSYGNGFANQPGMVFTFTLDNISSPKRVTNNGYFNNYIQALEVNPNNGLLYWASYYDTSTETQEKYKGVLFEIDPKTGEVTNLGDFQTELTSLCIPEKHTGGHWYDPTDEIASMELSAEQLRLLQGAKQQLSATILPWTVRDRTVTWISSDEAVATVDPDGVVTAVGDGQCTITATSNLNAAVTANCQVEVESVHSSVEGVLEDMGGNVRFFSWNLENDRFWTPGVVTNVPSPIGAAVYDAENDKMYIRDNDWVKMHEVDAATGNIVKSSGSSWYSVDDLTALQLFGTVETPQVVGVAGADVYKPCAPISNSFGSTWRLPTRTYTGGSNLVAITSMGQAVNEEGVNCDLLYAMDNAGYLWAIWYDGEEISYNYMNTELSQMELVFPQKGGLHCCSMVADEDGVLYFSYYNGAGNDLYRLRYDPAEDIYRVHLLGNFGEGNYPACLTLAKRNDAAQGEGGFSVPVAPAMRAEAVTRTEEDVAREALLDSKDALAQDVRPAAAEAAEPQEAPVGGLDAVQAGMVQEAREALRLPAELLHVGHETQCNGKAGTLTITADEETTNGLITLEYDATKLTLTEASGKALLNSFHEEAGCLTFGYANQEAIPAGSVLATVTFTAEAGTEAEFAVTTLENNEDYPGKVEHITVTVPEHDYIVSVVPATCEAGGYTLYTCRNCGESYKDHLTDALGHDWSAWTETREPTCTEAGQEFRTCARCCETETRVVEATGHTYRVDVVAPTCETDGYTLHTCELCGYNYRDQVQKATGHSYSEWTVTKEATCTEAGEETRTCASCNETETRSVAAKGHTLKDTVVAATCTTEGYTLHECTVCGYSYRDTVTPALGHQWGQWTVEQEADCFHDGKETRTCATCSETESRIVPANDGNCPSKDFQDLDCTRWYHEGVDFALDQGFMVGMGDGRFLPNGELTRGQLMTILYRMAGEPEAAETTPFADVKMDQYYGQAIAWAAENGIAKGITDTRFAPNTAVTREQLVTFLFRYAQFSHEDVKGVCDLTEFADHKAVSDFACEPMAWAVDTGILTGMDGLLNPKGDATRAQIATMLLRYFVAF